VLALSGCASIPSVSSLTSNPLVSSLTSGLGVNPEQAVGGTGAMLGLAQSKLSPEQFASISNAIPGASDITKAAGPLIGASPVTSMTDVNSAFSKLGMSPDMVSKFEPVLGDAVAKGGGPQAASLLGGLFK